MKKMTCPRPNDLYKFLNNKAFSVVELVIVVAIAGALVLVVANIPNSIGLIGKSQNESVAKEVATQKIESLRGQTYTNLANGTTPIADTRLTKLPGGTATSSIEDCPLSICASGQAVKKVTVTISWKEKNEPKSIILTTLISDGGLQ